MLLTYEQATLWPTVGIMAIMLVASFALAWVWLRAEHGCAPSRKMNPSISN
jgi:hypothetical protein